MTKVQFHFFIAFAFIISFLGLFIPMLEVDATQYASMSQELLQSNNFFYFTDLGQDYLDKPPLLFWLSSISISIFGNTAFAYKIPSFVVIWFGVWALYQIVEKYEGQVIARYSIIVITSTIAFFLFTNDVRTDTLLLGFVLLSIYFIDQMLTTLSLQSIILASLFTALAAMSKGPIAFIIPTLALLPHYFFKMQWKTFFQWRLLIFPLFVAIALFPMCYGLYEQFSWHGIRFFFWEQSFGRITGENVWKNEAGYFYLLENLIWLVIPFTLFLLGGFLRQLINWQSQKQYISYFGLLLPLIALSLSHYKLPHYTYIILPFAAIIIGKELYAWINHQEKISSYIYQSLVLLLCVLFVILPFVFFVIFSIRIVPLIISLLFLIFIVLFSIKYSSSFQLKSLFTLLLSFYLAMFIINTQAYPELLEYQASTSIGKYITKNKISTEILYQVDYWKRGFHYYSGKVIPDFNASLLKENKFVYVCISKEHYKDFKTHYTTEIIQSFDDYNVTRLKLSFLNPKTRPSHFSTIYLIKVQQ